MIPIVLGSSFFVAVSAPLVWRLVGKHAGLVLASVPAALFVYFLSQVSPIGDGEIIRSQVSWIPGLDISLSFRLDGLSLAFALLITGVGALVFLYSAAYMGTSPRSGSYYLYLTGFMASMLGLVLADNLIALFLFWELTSITSFLLIGFEHEREGAREAAVKALIVTEVGGLALLAGLVLLGNAAGSFELSEVLSHSSLIQESDLYLPTLLLILVGAFTKSAHFPFHFWLPGAMVAPTPVSAYLHSATMVKAGIYLLARLSPALGGTDTWFFLVGGVGGVTALIGGFLALQQTDLKKILAYATVSALGLMSLLIALGTEASLAAFLTFLLAHSAYKGALFLLAGVIDRETGTRDLPRLGGLAGVMPATAAAGTLAALSMAGVPPVFGFVAKESVLSAALDEGALVLLLVIIIAATFTAIAFQVGVRPFVGRRVVEGPCSEASPLLWLPPFALAGSAIFVGLAPALTLESVLSPALSASLGRTADLDLALWHGFNLELLFGGLALLFGLMALGGLAKLRSLAFEPRYRWGPDRLYERAIDGLFSLAGFQTRILQSGRLTLYMVTTLAVMTALTTYALLVQPPDYSNLSVGSVQFHEIAVVVLVLCGALAAVASTSRLLVVASLAVVGYGIALLYALFSAPDVAIAQFLAETFVAVLLIFAFYRLPRFSFRSSRTAIIRDAAIAVAGGVVMTSLLLAATSSRFAPAIAEFYARESLDEGHGRNIVNVILVDFRAFDTLGEIIVLSLAGLGVFIMLARRGAWASVLLDSLLLRTATQGLVPLMAVASLYLLVRGHDLPGGGFSGGLVMSGAVLVHAIAFGPLNTKRSIRIEPQILVPAGLSTIALAAAAGLLAGDPVLTGVWATLAFGRFQFDFGTPLLFDIGVYLCVVGAVSSIMLHFAKET